MRPASFTASLLLMIKRISPLRALICVARLAIVSHVLEMTFSGLYWHSRVVDPLLHKFGYPSQHTLGKIPPVPVVEELVYARNQRVQALLQRFDTLHIGLHDLRKTLQHVHTLQSGDYVPGSS